MPEEVENLNGALINTEIELITIINSLQRKAPVQMASLVEFSECLQN